MMFMSSGGKQFAPTGGGSMETLTIHLVKGVNLKNVQMIGKQDPYVKIKLGKVEKRSKVHNNGGKNPQWNQDIEFKVNEQKMPKWVFTFTVMDKETFSDNTIGKAVIPLKNLISNANKGEIAYAIKKGSKAAGEIVFSVKYSGKKEVEAKVIQPATTAQVVGVAPVVGGGAVYANQPTQPATNPYAGQLQQPQYAPPPQQYGQAPASVPQAKPVYQQTQPVYQNPYQQQPPNPYQQPAYAPPPQTNPYAAPRPVQVQPVYVPPQNNVYAQQQPQNPYQQPRNPYQQPAYSQQQPYAPQQPVSNPYAAQQPANPYAAPQPVNPYAAAAPQQTVIPQAKPVYAAATVVTTEVKGSVVVTVSGAGTSHVNGTYTYSSQEDGVDCFAKGNMHIMRHTSGSQTAWWICDWKAGNKNATDDYYFCKINSALPPSHGWTLDKHCKGRNPAPKVTVRK
eukprot:jgi/Bigna1/72858/fgenesh1_pg.21_\